MRIIKRCKLFRYSGTDCLWEGLLPKTKTHRGRVSRVKTHKSKCFRLSKWYKEMELPIKIRIQMKKATQMNQKRTRSLRSD